MYSSHEVIRQDFFFCNHLRQLHWRREMKTFYSDLSCDIFLLRSVAATAACCLCSDTAVNIETSCAAAPPSLAVGRGCEASFTQHKPSPYQLPARSRELTFRHYLSSLCLPSKWGPRGEGWISTDCAVIQTFRGVGSSSLASRRRLGSALGRFTAARVVGGASSWEYGQKMGGRNRR